MANKIFCATCTHFVRKSPIGKSNAGHCKLNPAMVQINMPTNHWCSFHKEGPQRLHTETYQDPQTAQNVPVENKDPKAVKAKVEV